MSSASRGMPTYRPQNTSRHGSVAPTNATSSGSWEASIWVVIGVDELGPVGLVSTVGKLVVKNLGSGTDIGEPPAMSEDVVIPSARWRSL